MYKAAILLKYFIAWTTFHNALKTNRLPPTTYHLPLLPMRLPADFYQRTDVVQIAKDLLGKVLITNFEGQLTAGRITETEAYRAPDDRASHAWSNRRTARTEVMFREGGCAYVYLCYGIHQMFNVVTAPEGMAHAVLVRAIEPLEGLGIMLKRRRYDMLKPSLTTGPGAVGQALGLHTSWSGQSLYLPDSPVWIETQGEVLAETGIQCGKRIGIAYAGACADWPWRFWIGGTTYRK